MAELALYVASRDDLDRLPAATGRLYCGTEHCLRSLPPDFPALLAAMRNQGMVSILLPPVREDELPHLERILDGVVPMLGAGDEIVFNDWGVLELLRRHPVPACAAGRLLTGQRRGPQRLTGGLEDSHLAQVPALLPAMTAFLVSLGVGRIELDMPVRGLLLPDSPGIALSVYEPPSIASFTLNCPHLSDGTTWTGNCRRECLTGKLTYRGGDAESEFIQKGRLYLADGPAVDVPPQADRLVRMRW